MGLEEDSVVVVVLGVVDNHEHHIRYRANRGTTRYRDCRNGLRVFMLLPM